MKTLLALSLLSICSLVSAPAHASNGETFTVEKVSPAYVYAYSISFEKPLNSLQQLQLAHKTSRESAVTAAAESAAYGYDFCAPQGKTVGSAGIGKTHCEHDKENGGMRCETPYRVLCEKI